MATPAQQLPVRFGKYELEEFLGGGMANVYRARDTVIGRTVAVKMLTEAGCKDADTRARFIAEGRMAGNIAHENILGIYDFGFDSGERPYMVMEFLRGEDLRHAIQYGRTGDLKRKLDIALQVARALAYVHTLKIVHRDIKPDNVYLNQAGVVKLIDFGIAKAEDTNLTRTGFVLGTPAYMAPEQILGKPITEQVDIYAFGLLLYELLCGVKPVQAETVESLFYAVLTRPLDPAPLAGAGIPPAICSLLEVCTQKEPTARPQGFPPVIAELEAARAALDPRPAAAERQGGAAAPAAAMPSLRVPILLGVAAALLVAVIVVAYLALHRLPATIATPTGEMVLVPEGDFLYGQKAEHATLPAFYIDRTEVTNAAYERFLRAARRPLPEGFPIDKPGFPVVNVTILNARDFAAWAGKRLPNAREWEKAARGADGRRYPWGNNADVARANIGTRELRPTHEFPNGASPYGALQMAGNAWELVNELTTPGERALERFKVLKPPPGPNEPWYMIRGQSCNQPTLSPDMIWDSASVPVRWKAADVGFRCVKDAR